MEKHSLGNLVTGLQPSQHSEHLGRFRGKLASDVCRRIPFIQLQNGTTHIVLDHHFRFLTYVHFVAYVQVENSLFVCFL